MRDSMNRIDKIISEEINRLISESFEDWASIEGYKRPYHRRRTASGEPVKRQKRPAATSLYDSRTVRDVGATLRKTWDSPKLRAIAGFNRNSAGMFGVANADAVYNFFNDANGNMFVQFQTKYNNIVKLTRDIETWAKEGDESGVNYRLCDLPKPLEELATIVNNMFNKFKELKKMRQFHPVLKPNGNKRGNIIDGYSTSNGLSNLVIAGSPKGVSEVTSKLMKCAEFIRNKFGDNLEHGSKHSNISYNTGRI